MGRHLSLRREAACFLYPAAWYNDVPVTKRGLLSITLGYYTFKPYLNVKGKFIPKTKMLVINYHSPSCCSKPVIPSLYLEHNMKNFLMTDMLSDFLP